MEPVIFDQISSATIHRAALTTKGSGGPTNTDSDCWKRILCSKAFGPSCTELCESVAKLARKLCTEHIPSEAISYLTNCRLVALDKGAGTTPLEIRPIGVGEVLRRIIGKSVMFLLKTDITQSAGPLQACAGHREGTEAAVHAMKVLFDKSDTEAVLLVDATNAFNAMNRSTALHNIQYLCPEMSTYLINTYRNPADLIISNSNGKMIKSEEGCTQGDNASMSFYACNTLPLISQLKNASTCSQAWFADDSAAAGKLPDILNWWKNLNDYGPSLGYNPNAGKTWLILKNKKDLHRAQQIFKNTQINITTEGKKHLGASLGANTFKQEYIQEKVQDWVEQLKVLSQYAKADPHAAYAAFTFGFLQKWKYVQRTVNDINHLFEPLEKCIRDDFIPNILGKQVSDTERDIVSLPTRWGGLNIQNPVETADNEYRWSQTLTGSLTNKIIEQTLLDTETEEQIADQRKQNIQQIRTEKNSLHKQKYDSLLELADPPMKRSLELAVEKGSSIWLNTLPIESSGYYLNKQEFIDSISLRYNFMIKGMASHCACGAPNSADHALVCRLGGYTIMRHNEVRNREAELLKEVCRDVQIEPSLIPLSGQQFSRSANHEDMARLDVSARDFWLPMGKAFFDIRIFHPNASSNQNKPLHQAYTDHEKEKKRQYNDRIIQVEHGTFTPLVFSTSGGESPECKKYHKHLASLISNKRKESYADTISFIRRKIRFCILRTALVSIRGFRASKQPKLMPYKPIPDTDISVSESAHRH